MTLFVVATLALALALATDAPWLLIALAGLAGVVLVQLAVLRVLGARA
jgi:hypothetical protein